MAATPASHPLPPEDTSGTTLSSWFGTAPALPDYPALAEDATADVVVIGGGIAGLTTAYLLSKEGRAVVLLEDGALASGESGRTTAHLSYALDDRFTTLENLFGLDGSRLAAESHRAAIARIEQLVQEEHIDCDFARLPGYLFLPASGTHQELMDELEAAHRAGLTDVEWLPRPGSVGFETGECLHFPGQGQFHILKYLAGLAEAIIRQGGRIYCHTRADEVKGGSAAEVRTTSGHTLAVRQAIVVATNSPFNDRVVMHTKQGSYRTYALAARVPKGSVAPALFWDTADPYHYIRLQAVEGADYDLLLVGGEDHKTGQEADPESHLRCLEDWVREKFAAKVQQIDYRWSGQVLEPNDSLGYAGRNPLDRDNVFIITGDSGHGMTHATLGALLITDLVQGRPNPWANLYDPGRITAKAESAKEFALENLNVAFEYTDLLTGGDVASADEIAAGQGAVLRRGLTKVAAYRDPAGQLHECSAICPHLGCVVHWNPLETSWDCPCHGSRFTALGELLAGPANSDLPKVEG
ncbi:FAD-dependent oxidoreductase [Hymenobacter sp. HMF4947]|uniref:FAD-dependent oxidoreductase n=1 Tax=Hymenobacter ginkgonis TaxID=2682976 RepID=A0A7K1TEB3_9BACT|nr:FAD-dependent oxidoreductase [Hymenobacter ginkgonis]MVN76736.1 FAD-dependent oxidoreductase [Hymenobacter ginkgonis]